MSDEILGELARVRALFQARAIVAAMGVRPTEMRRLPSGGFVIDDPHAGEPVRQLQRSEANEWRRRANEVGGIVILAKGAIATPCDVCGLDPCDCIPWS